MSNYRKLRATFNFLEWLDSRYMSIEALEDELTVSFSQNTIYYSIDLAKTWTALSPNTTTPVINTGDRIYFKTKEVNPSTDGIGTFTINKRCKACGNIMSLTDGYLNPYLFSKLFYKCTALVEVSSNFLPATSLAKANNCYYYMFYGCTSLIKAPKLPATELSSHCYQYMFLNCTSLVNAPELPATELKPYCYGSMFYGCTSLTTAPELPAITLTDYCYHYMFYGCTSLVHAPVLPATKLAIYCYHYMFRDCTSLVVAPELPATTLARYCYDYMFYGCTSLTTAPSILPATTLAEKCYYYMFYGCTSLVNAPELPATTLTPSCYEYMFYECTSLVNAPSILPATTLAEKCYYYMFRNCTSLIKAPELPATTLAEYCYCYMFGDCRSLTQAPELPATSLVKSCYSGMFLGCSGLNYIYAKFTTTPSSTYTNNWVSNVAPSGTFVKNYEATWDVTGISGVPSGWTVKKDTDIVELTTCTKLVIDKAYDVIGNDTITVVKYTATGTGIDYNGNAVEGTHTVTGTAYSDSFTQNTSSQSITKTIYFTYCGMTASTTITQGPWQNPDTAFVYIDALEDGLTIGYIGTLKYLIRGESLWRVLECGKTVTINTGERIYVLGQWLDGYSGGNGVGTFIFSKKCKVGGNSYSLVNIFNNSLKSYLFYKLFYNCTALVEVSSNFLPATKLPDNCYNRMFYGCTSLVVAPELPATTLVQYCYQYMFCKCTSLTTAPELPATKIGVYCYSYMFLNCTSLTTAPELPATTLFSNCYSGMFLNCTSLLKAPELPATSLNSLCYHSMFKGCTSLVEAPELPTSLVSGCYEYMFQGCTSLVVAPKLSSTIAIMNCYTGMFQGCTSLVVAPELPATVLNALCYYGMFRDCTSLVEAPKLPATVLSKLCYSNMFYGCTSLVEAPELPATTLAPYCYDYMFRDCTSLMKAPELPATTLAEYCYEYMFYGCTSLIKAPELPATELANYCYKYMFYKCSKLNFIYAKFTTTPSTSYTSSWVDGVASTGTFVKNYEATWDVTGISGVPSGWTVEKNIRVNSCTDLLISADDVNGRATTTTIHYSATCTATTYEGDSIVTTLTGTATSEKFPQNTSITDTVERTITYEFMGQTATTTITQGVWVDQFYSLDLNSLWQSSTITNPDSSLYDGIYESFSNKGVSNSAAIAYITINGYNNFKFYIRSYGESSLDYVMVSLLDLTIKYSTSYTTTDLVKVHTRLKSTSGTALSNYTLVEFTDIDGGEHTITVLYRKDSSENIGDDKGYLLIPKNQ